MAWTTPASYSVSEVLAAAKLNTHVRDNLRYLKGLDGSVTVDAQVTVAQVIKATGSSALLRLRDTGGAAEQKVSDLVAAGNLVQFMAINDAETVQGQTLWYGTRSGTNWSSFVVQDNVPAIFGDAVTFKVGTVHNIAGAWHATSAGVNRCFVGLDAAGVSPWRIFSNATGTNVFAVDLNTGVASFASHVTVGAASQVRTISGALTLAGFAGVTIGTTSGNIETTINIVPNSDNAMTCGANGRRWSAVWAANGSIQTSSRDTKQILGRVDPAEAMASLRGLPVYRFHYLKGDGEPDTDYTHTGPMAEEMPAQMMVQPGAVNGQDTAGYLTAALLDLDARLQKLEGEGAEGCPA